MSVGIFLFAICIVIATAAIGCAAEEYIESGKLCFTIICVGSALFLATVAMSFCFSSFRVLRYSLKYDHVVELEWKPGITQPPENLDWSKVVYHDVYSGAGSKECEQVIMAWDDDRAPRYDALVGKGGAE